MGSSTPGAIDRWVASPDPPAPTPGSRAASWCTWLVVAVQFALLAASVNDYQTTVDAGYHVTMARWYAEHGTAFWDHVNFAPAGRPNLQGPLLHMGIALVGRLLGGGGDAYVLANTLLALLQWLAAVGTAIYFARRAGGPWAALFTAALLTGNRLASFSFAVGIPSGWTFILAPWAIHFFLQGRLRWCVATTALGIYSHLAGYATVPVGVIAAALLTRRWRDLLIVGAGVLLATAPYTVHILRHLEWIRGTRGQAAPAAAPLLYLLSAPAALWLARHPRRHVMLVAWALEPAAWLLQNPLRYLAQVTLLCSVLGGVCIAFLIARLPRGYRAAVATLAILLSTTPWSLNDSALAANARWLEGTRYPRYIDWSEAREVADVLRREMLTERIVSSYNGSPCIAIGAFTPLRLEKGHWVEVGPRRDPAEQLSAGGKVYLLPLAPDDVLLRQLEQRGLISVLGGSARTTVATLPPSAAVVDGVGTLLRDTIADQATWLATHATNNVWLPPGVTLPAWRDRLLQQRSAAGRLELATILYAYALEPVDARAASALRGAGRGAGSLAYFLGDEGAEGFVSDQRHERMRVHAAALADAARRVTAAPTSLQPMISAFRTLFEDYFLIG